MDKIILIAYIIFIIIIWIELIRNKKNRKNGIFKEECPKKIRRTVNICTLLVIISIVVIGTALLKNIDTKSTYSGLYLLAFLLLVPWTMLTICHIIYGSLIIFCSRKKLYISTSLWIVLLICNILHSIICIEIVRGALNNLIN